MGDTRQKPGDRISLGRAFASAERRARGSGPHVLAIGVLLAAAAASADPRPASSVAWPVQSDLDGLYVHLGPQVGVVRRQGAWDSAVGGELSVLRVREDALLAIVGARVAGARWTLSDGGRIAFEGVAGTDLGVKIGATAGPLIDLGADHHPRIGASAAIWCYAGVVPYVRVGVIEASGGFVEAGLELPLPIWRHRR